MIKKFSEETIKIAIEVFQRMGWDAAIGNYIEAGFKAGQESIEKECCCLTYGIPDVQCSCKNQARQEALVEVDKFLENNRWEKTSALRKGIEALKKARREIE